MHNKCNNARITPKPSLPLAGSWVEKWSSMKLAPGTKKVGDPCTNRVLGAGVFNSVIMITESERVRMLPRINENHRKGSTAPWVHKTTHSSIRLSLVPKSL